MKFSLNMVVAAAVTAFAATGASANPVLGNAGSNGNSSVSFVAINGASDTSLTVDLVIDVASFVSSSTGLTTNSGALSSGGSSASWNFSTNTYTLNGVAQAGNFSWATHAGNFFTAAGSDYRWGVIGADGVSGNLSPTNTIFGQNLLYTSLSNDFDVSNDSGINGAAVASGAGQYNNYLAGTAGKGSHSASTRGSNVATAGNEFLGTSMAAFGGPGNFSQQFGTNDFLIAPTSAAKFYLTNAGGPSPRTFALGDPTALGAESDFAATWAWDQASSTLTYNVAVVPEPGTYAMLLAGLAAVGFMARRRNG